MLSLTLFKRKKPTKDSQIGTLQAITSQSPLLLLIIVTSTIFVSETLVMLLIPSLLMTLSLPIVAFIDSILLVGLIFPALYFFLFRQSRLHTTELLKANEQLRIQIAKHKQAVEALQKNEEKYRTLVETMNEGLVMIDENGLWTYANDKLCYMLGHFQGELVGRPVIDFVDEAHRGIFEEEMATERKGEHRPYELTWKNKNGIRTPTIASPKPLFSKNGEFKGSFAIITDITERKQAEETLRESEKQLRYLSSQLLTIQEQERKRISAELHDELGQALAVMKLRLKVIEKSLGEDQDTTRKDCEETLHYIDQVIENVRRMSRDLSPSILEDFGFSAALRRMVSEFTKHHYIKSSLDIFDIDHLFSPRAHILLYRIFQEALTNIGKHSGASQVTISIRRQNGGISFLIGDNGKGFNIEEVTTRDITEKGLGLVTLSERIRMLGGAADIRSEEGKGTRISFTIPMEARQE